MTKQELYEHGLERVTQFCAANDMPLPKITTVPSNKWRVNACAYYRFHYIKICLPRCAAPCTDRQKMAWSWPGNKTDRTPYGVLAHELGHAADRHASEHKGSYGGEYSRLVAMESGEREITSYCPNVGEWFAEMFKVFVTNHALLRELRPKTHEILSRRFTPVSDDDWYDELNRFELCPERIVNSLMKHGAEIPALQ